MSNKRKLVDELTPEETEHWYHIFRYCYCGCDSLTRIAEELGGIPEDLQFDDTYIKSSSNSDRTVIPSFRVAKLTPQHIRLLEDLGNASDNCDHTEYEGDGDDDEEESYENADDECDAISDKLEALPEPEWIEVSADDPPAWAALHALLSHDGALGKLPADLLWSLSARDVLMLARERQSKAAPVNAD